MGRARITEHPKATYTHCSENLCVAVDAAVPLFCIFTETAIVSGDVGRASTRRREKKESVCKTRWHHAFEI